MHRKKISEPFTIYLRNKAAQINNFIKFRLLVDFLAVILSLIITAMVRYGSLSGYLSVISVFLFAFSAAISNLICGCYQYLWKYIGLSDAIRQCFSSVLNFSLMSVFIIINHALLKSDAFSLLTPVDAGLCVFLQLNFMILFRFSYRIQNIIYTYIAWRLEKGTRKKVIVFCRLDDCRDILEKKTAVQKNSGRNQHDASMGEIQAG